MDDGAVLGRVGIGGVYHGNHGYAEIDAQAIDDGETEEHEDGEVEAGGATLRRNWTGQLDNWRNGTKRHNKP